MEDQFSNKPNTHNPEIYDALQELNNLQSLSSLYTIPKEVWEHIRSQEKATGQHNILNVALKHSY